MWCVMVRSMTGFGRSTLDLESYSLTCEMKAVNHRYLDVTFHLPQSFTYLEDVLKKVVKQTINRGKLYITITINPLNDSGIKIEPNWAFLDQYMALFRSLKTRYHLSQEIKVNDLLQHPDALIVTNKEDDLDEVESAVIKVVQESLDHLVDMRKTEGKQLALDLYDRLQTIKSSILEIEELAPQVTLQYESRLRKRVQDYLNHSDVEVDEARLLNEIALFADKSNIDEELTRLNSHTKQFKEILMKDEPIGRKLDFLIQEMQREINTIGSKGNDERISVLVISIKSEIEKCREQIQNIE